MDINEQATEFADALTAMRTAMASMNAAMDRVVRVVLLSAPREDVLGFEVTPEGAAALAGQPWQVTHSGAVQFTGSQAECRDFAEANFPAGGYGIGPVFSDDE